MRNARNKENILRTDADLISLFGCTHDLGHVKKVRGSESVHLFISETTLPHQ